MTRKIDVKIAVTYLLEFVLLKYCEEICCGCRTKHTSQIQNECLWEIPDIHFQDLLKRLWTV